jgi:hypothetical protein
MLKVLRSGSRTILGVSVILEFVATSTPSRISNFRAIAAMQVRAAKTRTVRA